MSIFSVRVRDLRLSMNLSLRQLAKITGISHSAIAAYESDKRAPKREALEALSDVFNCDIDYLLGRTDIKNSVANSLGYDSLYDAYKTENVSKKMKIGEKIKLRREELKWSQRDLAEKMGYNHSTITRIETGKIDIPQSRIAQFAEVLHTNIAYLMDWSEDQKEKPTEDDRLSNAEKNLLDLFRQVPQEQQALVIEMIKVALKKK